MVEVSYSWNTLAYSTNFNYFMKKVLDQALTLKHQMELHLGEI